MKRIPVNEVALRILCAMLESGKEPQGSTTVKEAFALALMFDDHAGMLEKQEKRGALLAFNDDGT